jgi:hypothetical protein
MLNNLIAALIGPAQARAAQRQALARTRGLMTGLEALADAVPPDGADGEAPIFLLSAGWRSGSTLLQRLIMSDRKVLIWGEPYDECGLIQHLAASNRAFRPGWPRADYFYDGTPIGQLSGNWVANLFPALGDWRAAHRALFQTLFARPAQAAGAGRWGIKEVRLTAEHCHYLRWLYPDAKFLFLYRHPLDAYRSYCSFGRNWYDTYPDHPVFTPRAFGRHWRGLMDGFLAEADGLGALLVRYEDLIADVATVRRVEAYLGITIDHGLLRLKVRNSGNVRDNPAGKRPEVKVSALETWLLRRAVGPTAAKLDYRF